MSFTRNSPDMSLGSSVSRRAVRVRASRLFASIWPRIGSQIVANTFLTLSEGRNDIGRTHNLGTDGGIGGTISQAGQALNVLGRRSANTKTSARSFARFGRRTANPVLPVRPSSLIKVYDPFPGRTVPRIVSPILNTRFARLGASFPFIGFHIFSIVSPLCIR